MVSRPVRPCYGGQGSYRASVEAISECLAELFEAFGVVSPLSAEALQQFARELDKAGARSRAPKVGSGA